MIDYAASFTNTTGAFPDIVADNVSAPGAGDGTEFVKLMIDDIWGRAQAIMNYAGLAPDGVSEADGTAQILEALNKGWGIGPGMGVIYWKNGTPAANGDRILLLQGQVILIATYSELVDACYVGDGNNATAATFYKTSDAGGTTRDTAGSYFVLPDTRGLSLKNIGDATISTRTKTGPTEIGEVQEDQSQAWQLGADEDATGARDYWSKTGLRDNQNDFSAQANYTAFNLITTAQGDSQMVKAMNDGTNGDPRSGLNTRDSTIGTNFGITY